MKKIIKPKVIKLEQDIINSYEKFIVDVYEAIRVVSMGSGKKYDGNFHILLQIINQEEKKMWEKISEAMTKQVKKESSKK